MAALKDKISLVTGGARRIGREIALRLAEAGSDVAVHYGASAGEVGEVVERIRSLGRRSMAFEADLLDLDAAQSLPRKVAENFGGLDILVNNAASFHPTEWGASTSEHWLDVLRLNFVAPVLMAQACGPIFRQRGGGQIVNLTDIYARRPMPGYAAYCASKAALESMTMSLARLMAPGVRVNAVAPGAGIFPEEMPQRERDHILARVPLARAGSGREVAEAVLYLLSQATYVTGQTLVVDGGRSVGW